MHATIQAEVALVAGGRQRLRGLLGLKAERHLACGRQFGVSLSPAWTVQDARLALEGTVQSLRNRKEVKHEELAT